MGNIKLSICCASYNHGKYLKEALNGILMQKVNFEYEVIIGDDCSTDDSQSIIESFRPKFKKNYITFLNKKNVGALNNFDRIQSCTRGEYVIVLETDDRWTDPLKIQKQVDYLDLHPEVIAVAHKCNVIDKNSKPTKFIYPQCNKKKYSLGEYRKGIMPGQTTTMMYRNYHSYDLGIDTNFISKCNHCGPGDRAKIFALLARGQIHCLSDVMSDYRYVWDEGTSFSATDKMNYSDYINYYGLFVKYAKDKLSRNYVDAATSVYSEMVFSALFLGREISVRQAWILLKPIDRKYKVFFYVIIYILHIARNKIVGKISGYTYM